MADGPHELPVQRAALIILDGWGLAEPGPGNAIELADTPVFDELWARFPTTTLTACGRAVGLPDGQMGNSEVGHLNLGAGSVVMQDLTFFDFSDHDVASLDFDLSNRAGSLAHLPSAMFALRRLVASEKPDIVQGWLYYGNLLTFRLPTGRQIVGPGAACGGDHQQTKT